MTLTEKVKDITEFYYKTAEFMCDNSGFFKKQFGTFDKFNKVFADIILHEYEMNPKIMWKFKALTGM